MTFEDCVSGHVVKGGGPLSRWNGMGVTYGPDEIRMHSLYE